MTRTGVNLIRSTQDVKPRINTAQYSAFSISDYIEDASDLHIIQIEIRQTPLHTHCSKIISCIEYRIGFCYTGFA